MCQTPRRAHLPVALAVLLSLGTSAAETPEADPATDRKWSSLRFQREFCGEDSWEPFNRTMFGIFDWCAEYIADPFCYLYSSIIPKPLIRGIDNFSVNLEEPCAIFANLFMGEWNPAWDETRRFVVNSTLGIGGLFDPAEDWFYIYGTRTSLSDTFTAWGIPAGPPLALPFLARASVRGHLGNILDYGLDLKTYVDFICPSEIFVGYTWLLVPNKAPVWREHWESLFYHANDPYSIYMPVCAAMNDFNLRQFAWRRYEEQFNKIRARKEAKDLYPEDCPERRELFDRAEKTFPDARPPIHESAKKPDGLEGLWRDIPGFAPRAPCLDSLRALCFYPLGDDDFWWERRSLFNRDFSKRIDEREIVIATNLPNAVYSFVPPETSEGRPPAAKLAVILPGIGAGRTASEAVAMAELLHAHGYAAVICDSLFHHEHVRSVNRGILPGYLPKDVRRYADYLARILDDLKREYLSDDSEISVIGWSMGALTVAHMAAMDTRGELPFRAHRFVALNPPVSMEHALAPFRAVYESSRDWTRETAQKMFTEVSISLYGWADQDHPRYDPDNPPLDLIGDPWDYAPNLTEEQANYLLGQTLRVVFPTLVAERHKTVPFPWIKSELTWFHRSDFYEEIGDVSMDEYIRKYLLTCYEGVSAEEIIATDGIRHLESELARNLKFSILHTWNDPLEDDSDRRWFDRTFRDRITWFADGGHCGYFYTKPFETELFRRLGDSQ